MHKTADDLLNFWFHPDNLSKQFEKSDAFDQEIREQFGETWQNARDGLLYSWRETLRGRLAEIIILDQFSRNLNRESPLAYAQDGMALVLAQELISQPNFEEEIPVDWQHFAYLPFMHSESKAIHQIAIQLYEDLNQPEVLEYEKQHKVIIDRFDRYPHRNEILGRTSTEEELAFLQEPNSSF